MHHTAPPYRALSGLILRGLLVPCLTLWLTGCATGQGSAVSPVRCQHPEVDPYTNSGLAVAVQAYGEALDLCNTLNGYPLED
ncbi:Rz-like spanin [Pseudomonas phage phiNV3]|uniref:Putative Rz1-like protein n=1 Tax=Pseudomonas phage phiNV3 TaxID=2079544 RepID=A0A2P0ZLN2_9CAUD|nr:Rz-like spanin [Pseudomonas phage phiNV3]ARB30336.1 hypothetical protein B5P22_24620 [Pseudomonas tolaasii]AVH86155.1 putative Rz1-like protein [Pseudomonas phage phiNV3]